MPKPSSYWIRKLRLRPHPEGGYYRETYRSGERVAGKALPARYRGGRCFSTAIFFLLEERQISALHRIQSDEIWHFYAGSALVLSVLDAAGRLKTIRLGPDPGRGEVLQAVIPRGCWFGARVADARSYALAGCTVAPGFDFADFELADRAALCARFPRHARLIRSLTRQSALKQNRSSLQGRHGAERKRRSGQDDLT